MITPAAHPEWALCLGGADCVWEDVRQWEREVYGRIWDGMVIAANDVGAHWPGRLDHWVSLHGYKFRTWRAERASRGLVLDGIVTWGKPVDASRTGETDRVLVPWEGGDSGLLAVRVAGELGCTRVVLCGMPITPTPHFVESTECFHSRWLAADAYWRAWKRQAGLLVGWVRSMSGRTRELLGAPTREWLAGTWTSTF